MAGKVKRLGSEKIGKLLFEMSSQTTFSLLVYADYSLTNTYFLSVGINSLAAAGASIISPVLITLGRVAAIVGAVAPLSFPERLVREISRKHPELSRTPS